jgi:PAS domain S-box-containing protein
VHSLLFREHPDPAWLYDPVTLVFLAANRAAERRYGWSEQEFRGMTVLDLRPPPEREAVAELLHGLSPERGSSIRTTRHWTRSGEVLTVEVVGELVQHENGPARLILARDITAQVGFQQERERLLQRERASRARAEAALKDLAIAGRVAGLLGWRYDRAARRLEWTGDDSAIRGAPRPSTVEEAVVLFAPCEIARARDAFNLCVREGRPFDLVTRVVVDGGHEVVVRAIGEAERDAAGRLVGARGALQDLTDLMEARAEGERQARLAEERFRLLAQATHDVIWDLDLRTGAIWWNEHYERLFGHVPDPSPQRSWTDRVHPQDRERALASIRAAFDGTDSHWQAEYRFLCADGRVLDVMDRCLVIRNSRGKAVRAVGSMMDVTDKRRMEARLRQAQRLDAVGQLTGGLAHDFNNLLTVILGTAEVLGHDLAARPDLQALATTIATAAERGSQLTSRLLAYARKQALQPVATDIARLLTGLEPLVRRALGERLEVRLATAPALPPALVDPGQLESAVLNLCINARDAMPAGGQLLIQASAERLEAGEALALGELPAGDYVVIAVADTGEGMPPEVQARAFEPFFTTKAPGAGSGLGLSMVDGFVRQSRGAVRLCSEAGRGTTVTLYLPCAPERSAAAAPAAPGEGALPQAAGERVLLVEDNELVRRHVATLLGSLGYCVQAVGAGAAALAVLEADPAAVDLLFTDVVMPGMNGCQLAQAARRLRPGLPVLLTTGYADDAALADADVPWPLLHKPWRREDLARKLREVLAGAVPLTA